LPFRADVDVTPVAICTVALPVAPAVTTSLTGLNVQAEFTGSPLQANVKVPLDPLIVASLIAKLAVCPLDIVWLDCPDNETEKSNPVPDSDTSAGAASDELEKVRFPVCAPASKGENATCALQLAPASSDTPQFVDPSLNWLEAESATPAKDTEPLLVKVTARYPLVFPTPVIGKFSDVGCTWIDPAAPPVPLRDRVAAVTNAEELTVSAPVTTPFEVGVNFTPAEHEAPAASVELQLFCTKLNKEETESTRPLAATLLVFVMVAVCAALDCPSVGCVKDICCGLMMIPEAVCPIPLRET
jgi:hypothetical protein